MIDPQSLDLTSLPSVMLEDRSQLPQTPCIYFAIDALGTIQYIGRSVNLRSRWACHHRYDLLQKMDGVSIAYVEAPPYLLDSIENALIEWFQPPLNKVFRSREIPETPGIHIILKQAREARGLSQNELARAVNMTPQYIQKIEYGKAKSIPLDTLDRFCKALECTPGDLLVYIPDQA